MGVLLTALSIVSPLKFIAPGAVVIAAFADKERMGRTAFGLDVYRQNAELHRADVAYRRSLELFRYRDRDFSDKIVKKLMNLNVNVILMHVCGTHQDTIVRYGLDSLLESCGIDIRQGPGCPICVTTPTEYEEMITLAEKGAIASRITSPITGACYERDSMISHLAVAWRCPLGKFGLAGVGCAKINELLRLEEEMGPFVKKPEFPYL
jgi:hypothetical protein